MPARWRGWRARPTVAPTFGRSSPARAASSSPARSTTPTVRTRASRSRRRRPTLALRLGRRLSRRPEGAPRRAARPGCALSRRSHSMLVRTSTPVRCRSGSTRSTPASAGSARTRCLINAELGSWLFLGEIICTLDLEPDTEGLEQCGSCTRCLDACPTGALVEAGVLDSTRCISYLTIELAVAIPRRASRRRIGTHVYGCDICQEVCPYNQPPPRSADAAVAAASGARPAAARRLCGGARMPSCGSPTKGSAMTRAKLTGLRRNLAVAIGNSGDADGDRCARRAARDAAVGRRRRWCASTSSGRVAQGTASRDFDLSSKHVDRAAAAAVDAADDRPEFREDRRAALRVHRSGRLRSRRQPAR